MSEIDQAFIDGQNKKWEDAKAQLALDNQKKALQKLKDINAEK